MKSRSQSFQRPNTIPATPKLSQTMNTKNANTEATEAKIPGIRNVFRLLEHESESSLDSANATEIKRKLSEK